MMDGLRHRAGVESYTHGQGIDVDTVVEHGLKADLDYIPLPVGILGQTHFYPNGMVRIELSRELAERSETDVVARRRLRSTLAHECGHVVCHTSLHVGDTETLSLFPEGILSQSNAEPIMCREDRIDFRYQGEWWEYQANQCMAALLLPRSLFSESTREVCRRNTTSDLEEMIRLNRALNAIHDLADEYDVSRTLVLYRLKALGFIPSGLQHGLKFDD
jgi:hypothetical protein